MSINIENTRKAYEMYITKGGPMEYLTKQVHEYVLLSGFMETHGKSVLKAINSIADKHDELLVATFIGKLRNKLPQLRMGIKLKEFDKERARLIAASLITQVFIDNEAYEVDKRIEPTTIDGHKKFHTRLYMQLGGSFEKDLMRGIEDKPGVVHQKDIKGWKLGKVEKAFLRKVSSIPFELSSACSKELLLKGYSLKTDWNKKVDKNGRTLPEDPIMKKRRYNVYANTIIDQVGSMPVFYLPMKYCDRDRMYYEAAVLDGIRPHGKLWETLMIDAAVPFDLTEDDECVLKHLIYVTLHDRVSLEEANDKFSIEDYLDAQSISPFDQDCEEGFGEAILLNKAAKALDDYRDGNTSKFMFGYDFTNSGLMMSGVSFKSEKMMMAANMGGSSVVHDSHTDFGKGFDVPLERKEIKSIHMGLLHGSALQTIGDTITQILVEKNGFAKKIDVEHVKEFTHKAYGKPVDNITNIAEWGTKIIGNEQSVLRWTMPDKFSACSRSYIKSVPVLVYSASASHKDGYTSHVVVSDMPWVEDKNGYPIYGKEVLMGGTVYEVQSKKRGLYANLTHSIDSYMLRKIGNAVIDSGRPMLFKHDDFITPPSAYHLVKATAKDGFVEMFNTNLYQEAVNEIAEHSPYNLEPLELIEGDASCTVWESENFLMP